MKKLWIALVLGVGVFGLHTLGLFAAPSASAEAAPMSASEFVSLSRTDPEAYRKFLRSHAGH